MNEFSENSIILYTTVDGRSNISLYARDGSVWLNQSQMAELFDTSKPNISIHISNILEDKELQENSVVKFYLTTASDGKRYSVAFYSLEMMIAVGFRVRSVLKDYFLLDASEPAFYFMRGQTNFPSIMSI